MPNRIIKDSITKSEKLSELTDFQFRLWVHLITYVDDYGRGDARPAIIRGACFPLRDRMTNKDIEKGLADLAGAGCVGLYKVDGKPYLYFPNWEKHQRVRQKVSKCPAPEDCDEELQDAANGGELPQDAARIQSRIQNPNPESRIQNPNTREARGAGFEEFWKAYPKKKAKHDAMKAFEKVTVPLETLLQALEQQKKSTDWQKENGQFIPHPATWLNGKRWEDQLSQAGYHKGGQRQLDADEIEAVRRMMGSDLPYTEDFA